MKLNVRNYYGNALVELGREDPDVVAFDADLSNSTKTAMFGNEFPERFFNMGICEQDMVSTAAGMAACGKIPFVSTFSVFVPGRCFDQIRMCIAYPEMNVKLVSTHGGISVGKDGPSHHAVEDLSLMKVLPDFNIFVPCDPLSAYSTIKTIHDIKGPCYVRLFRDSVESIYDEDSGFDPLHSHVLQDGDDLAIIGHGFATHNALAAGKMLEAEGYSARIIDLQVLRPLDEKTILRAAKDCGNVLTVEDHSIFGGMGSTITDLLSQRLPTKVSMLGVDRFTESGRPDDLYDKYGLSARSIVEKSKELIR
ncbi:MAG TPA: transketolase C-terminal domain-containing protein [Candidatus Methanofastidiosa archaeon]|nr:transketolase C-terminal domain-containing protein [Candidatus Methanofastidiosa archaeon]